MKIYLCTTNTIISAQVKFGDDPLHDPELMTSYPVYGFSLISRELFVIETSSYHHSTPRLIVDHTRWIRFVSVRADFRYASYIFIL